MGDAGSERSKEPGPPPRCPCGFWGSSETLNLCPKCYTERSLREEAPHKEEEEQEHGSAASTSHSGETVADCGQTTTSTSSNQQSNGTPRTREEHEQRAAPAKRSYSCDSPAKSEASALKRPRLLDGSSGKPEVTRQPKQKSRRRCFQCNKKLQLAEQELGVCRCGFVFCLMHRLAEKHSCTFDYIEHGRQEARKKLVKRERKLGTACQRIS